MRFAWARAKDGEADLQSFGLNKTPKARAGLIATTWRMPVVGVVMQDQNIQIISETVKHIKKSIDSSVLKAFSEAIE